jgi:hypothetical protein
MLSVSRQAAPQTNPQRYARRPLLEEVEDRCVPATFP